MKKNLYRLFAVTVLLLSMFLFTGCDKKQNNDKEATPEGKLPYIENQNSNVTLDSKVITVEDIKVTYQEIMIYILRMKARYETTLTDAVWSYNLGDGQTFEDVAKQEIIDEISMLKIISQKASKIGVSLDSDEMDEVRDYAANIYGTFSQEDRDTYGIDLSIIETMVADNYLAEKVFEVSTNNVSTEVSDNEAKQIKIEYITFLTKGQKADGTSVDLGVEEKKAVLKKAKQVLKEAKEADDFAKLAKSNSDIEETEITLGKGMKEAPFENVAFDLKTGKVSGVVETPTGYYIIKCISSYDEDATAAKKEEIIHDRQMKAFQDLYSEWLKESNIKINEKIWNQISFTSLSESPTPSDKE